jgi:hypothetical protein
MAYFDLLYKINLHLFFDADVDADIEFDVAGKKTNDDEDDDDGDEGFSSKLLFRFKSLINLSSTRSFISLKNISFLPSKFSFNCFSWSFIPGKIVFTLTKFSLGEKETFLGE